jgi:hypothetical protein
MKFLFWGFVCLLAQPAMAQVSEAPAGAGLRLGPVALAPRLIVRNIGIDTTVFDASGEPVRDLTATVGAEVESRWRVRRARVTGVSSIEAMYFERTAGGRTVNGGQQLRVALPLNRIMPYSSANFMVLADRPNFEIDARVPRTAADTTIGTEIRLTERLSADISIARSRTDYARTTGVFGRLDEVLNNRSVRRSAAVRFAATPLTTIFVKAETQRDRFKRSQQRDADTIVVSPGVVFNPFALVNGNAYVGYRRFSLKERSAAEFAGTVAGVDLSYTLRGETRFTSEIQRDVAFSLERTEPYYVQTGVGFSVERHIAGSWDVRGHIERQRLAYRGVEALTFDAESRVDVVDRYIGTLGYRFGRERRIVLDFEYLRRHSARANRQFRGVRCGVSIAYPL